ncbi:MAG: glycosyltransferase [Geminicoccaceae bacterium]|nr:glycosyltransferase [Geminicoccaceae bacterium]
MISQPHLLHLLPGFGTGGIQSVLCSVINGLGRAFRHTIVSLNGDLRAGQRLAGDLDVELHGSPAKMDGLRERRRLIRSFEPDLVLTSNWGCFDWVIAQAIAPAAPHIHQEHGFGPDEAHREIARRVWARRLVLPFVHRLVVPSVTLEEKARTNWWLKADKVVRIANGVESSDVPARDELQGRDPSTPASWPDDRVTFVTVAPLRPEKRIDRLIRAFTAMPDHTRTALVIVGDGPERPALEALARESGLEHEIVFLGHQEQPARILAHGDIYAITSDTEQLPASVLDAMALGMPVVGTAVGDVPVAVSQANRRFTVQREDEAALTRAMSELAADESLRKAVGDENRRRQRAEFDARAMVEAYGRLFHGACRH